MKLKIVATKKDILIFLLFAVFLLYVVALAVLNLPQLAGEGTFYGLNPMLAFSSEYIKYTLVVYLVFLAGLFFSVKSYFFETKSGVGFSFSSGNDGGYSSWAKTKDIQNDSSIKKVYANQENSDFAGIPLISNGKELWVDNGEYHNLVIGATGSGKTVSTILPTVKVLAKKKESIICTDPKGEIYEKTGGLLKNRGYDIILLNFRDPQKGNAWNPLTLPYKLYKSGNQDKAIELLDDLALNILYDGSSNNSDPFWEKTAADYFAGIALAMFEDTTEDKININSINMTATVGEDKFGGSTYVKEYFNYKDPSSSAYINASGTVMAPSETKGGIISVFKQKVKLFASRENLSEMLSYSDFELESIGKKPTAVFIIIQDEKKTYHSLATIFVKQVYETLIDVAQGFGGKLPYRTNFLLDEFANMPPLKDVTTMITAARSRQIRFTMIIQNFAQLNKVYGKDDAETIKGNCGNIIYLISTELAALEEISKLCGEKKSKKDDKTASTPLVTVSDLQRMKQFDQIVLRMRKNPFKTSFVPDFKINWGSCSSPKVDYPEREKRSVQIFDIREFVKAKKNQKINEMMANMGNVSTSSAPMGGAGGMPFAPMPRKTPDISVDDLVKKIDQKLAEIEKEEQEQKRKKAMGSENSNSPLEVSFPKYVDEATSKKNTNFNKRLDDIEILGDDKSDVPRPSSETITSKSNHGSIELGHKKNNHVKSIDDYLLKDTDTLNKKEKMVSSSYIEDKVNKKLASSSYADLDASFDSSSFKIDDTSVSEKTSNFAQISKKESGNNKNTIFDDSKDNKVVDLAKIDEEKKSYAKDVSTKKYKEESVDIIDGINLYDDALNYELDAELEREMMLDSLDKKFKEHYNEKAEIVEAKIEEKIKDDKDSNNDSSNRLFKPTATIKLEDASDDEKFFDDFFED